MTQRDTWSRTWTLIPSLALLCATSIISITDVASSHFTERSVPFLITSPKFRNSSMYAPASTDGQLYQKIRLSTWTRCRTHSSFVTARSSASILSIVPHRYSGSRPYCFSRIAFGDDNTLSWLSCTSMPYFRYVPFVPLTMNRTCGERTDSVCDLKMTCKGYARLVPAS